MLTDRNLLSPMALSMEQLDELLLAEQAELDTMQAEIDLQERQLLLSTADITLARYERMFAVTPLPSATIQQRRQALIAKLNSQANATVTTIQEIVEIITGLPCEIEERYADYMFRLRHRATGDYMAIQKDIRTAVDTIKPAHIAYAMTYVVPLTARTLVASHTTTAHKITILPYMPPPIEVQARPILRAWHKVGQTITILRKD